MSSRGAAELSAGSQDRTVKRLAVSGDHILHIRLILKTSLDLERGDTGIEHGSQAVNAVHVF